MEFPSPYGVVSLNLVGKDLAKILGYKNEFPSPYGVVSLNLGLLARNMITSKKHVSVPLRGSQSQSGKTSSF